MDFDDDGKKDIVAGDTEGAVWWFRNIGTDAAPELAEGRRIEANGKPIAGARRIYEKVDGDYKVKETIPGNHELSDTYSKLDVADFDDDGLKDLLIGHNRGEILLYRNIGIQGAPKFGDPERIAPGQGAFPTRPSPVLVDWDGDGTMDLLLGSESGEVHFFPNQGTNKKPRFVSGESLKAGGKTIRKGSRARLDVADWNNDGKLDLLLGDFFSMNKPDGEEGRTMGGNVWLFLRN